jgi:hypothetical protein
MCGARAARAARGGIQFDRSRRQLLSALATPSIRFSPLSANIEEVPIQSRQSSAMEEGATANDGLLSARSDDVQPGVRLYYFSVITGGHA